MLQRRHGAPPKIARLISWNCPCAVDPDFDDEDAAIAHYREAVTQHGCGGEPGDENFIYPDSTPPKENIT